MFNRIRRSAIVIAIAVGVAACASTTIRSTWTDPGYTAGPFRKILVIGLNARDVTARRLFEDALAARLSAASVQAVPAWQRLSGVGEADEGSIATAIAETGADGLLMARLLGIDARATVSPAMMAGPGFGWYGAYSGWYAFPLVAQYDVAVIETTLFETATKRLVWSGTSETRNPESAQREAPGFADAVVAALQRGGFLPPAR